MYPMTLRKMKIRKQSLAGFQERLNGLRVERLVTVNELSLEFLRLLVRLGVVQQSQLLQDLVVSFLGNLIQDVAHLMYPTPLMAALGIHLPDRLPEPVQTIADHKADPFDPSLFKAPQEICS